LHLGSALQPKPLDENEKAEEAAAENTAELGEVTVVRESQSRATFAAAAVPATSARRICHGCQGEPYSALNILTGYMIGSLK